MRYIDYVFIDCYLMAIRLKYLSAEFRVEVIGCDFALRHFAIICNELLATLDLNLAAAWQTRYLHIVIRRNVTDGDSSILNSFCIGYKTATVEYTITNIIGASFCRDKAAVDGQGIAGSYGSIITF